MRNNNRNHKKSQQSDRIVHLKPIVAQTLVTRKVQYLCTTANSTNQVVTVNQLASMLPGFMALTATLGGYLTNQFKINKISLWSPPPVQGSNTANSLKFSDTFNAGAGLAGPSKMVADSSMEPDRPAFCKIVPKPPYSWFQNTGSGNNYLVFTAPLGSIFEFSYSHYIDDSGTISTGPTIVAATAGVIYHKIVLLSQGMVLSPHTSLNGI
jgi:hypothetical protein